MAHPPAHGPAPAHRPHPISAFRYLWVWVALVALTATTFGVSKLPMSGSMHLGAAVFIACVKVFLVASFFMHLWGSEGTNKLVFGVSFVFVATLLFFVLADVATRFPLTNSHIRPLPQIDQKILETQEPHAPEPPAR
ncbi:MAG TPA: cytochrome C oxidase subunit IV family protein [Myxococcaceae bacterium]|nr:cytochrome C oxidase subunit IV family protein [Myxococcaceae bacterium]